MFIYIYIYTCQYEFGRTKVTYIWEEMESLKTKIKSCIDLVLKKVSFDLIETEE